MLYKVWWDNVDEFYQLVTINWLTQEASSTCEKFEEMGMGILYFHIIRMFNIFHVKKILEKYILDRWKKNIKHYEDANNARSFDKYASTSSSIWRLQMM